MDRAVVERLLAIINDMERTELERHQDAKKRIAAHRRLLRNDCPHSWGCKHHPDESGGSDWWDECLACGGEI